MATEYGRGHEEHRLSFFVVFWCEFRVVCLNKFVAWCPMKKGQTRTYQLVESLVMLCSGLSCLSRIWKIAPFGLA